MVGGDAGPIQLAVADLLADLRHALPMDWATEHASESVDIEVYNKAGDLDDESYRISLIPERRVLRIEGGNELGAIFGIYRVSKDLLGVDPFYRWTGTLPEPRREIALSDEPMVSPKPRFRFRGWFINGEDSLIAASGGGSVDMQYFDWVFETLLRTGNNLVIPGTFPVHPAQQYELAVKRGLWLTHHHAEPLGAPLFSYVYPDIEPDFRKEKERFRKIYVDTVNWYAQRKAKAVFTVNLRGQGDRPFWRDFPDIQFSEDEKRAIILEAINLQLEVLREVMGPGNFRAVFPLYAEAYGLFCNHVESFPPEVILCWADNGYGAMRVRRAAGVTDETQSALPSKVIDRPQGVYYHVNFHDLEASNQLTMLVDPELIVSEYQKMLGINIRTFSICNAGNVRPHIYALDLLSEYIGGGLEDGTPEEVVKAHGRSFFARWFGEAMAETVFELQREYFRCPLKFGDFPDQKAGDEFYHYTARAMICRTLNVPDWGNSGRYILERLGGLDGMLEGAARWAEEVQPRWQRLAERALEVRDSLTQGKAVFDACLYYQIAFNGMSNRMLSLVARTCQAWRAGRYREAFILAESAHEMGEEIVELMWRMDGSFLPDFYMNEFLTNARSTRHCLRLLLEMTRVQVDGPTMFLGSSIVSAGHDKPNYSILPLRYYYDDSSELANGMSQVLNIPKPEKAFPDLPSDFPVVD